MTAAEVPVGLSNNPAKDPSNTMLDWAENEDPVDGNDCHPEVSPVSKPPLVVN